VNALDELRMSQKKPENRIPKFEVGDTVRVHFRIVEGEKERIQVYEGTVIARKGEESPEATFTVRRVAYNEGVERVFPLHSPRVERVEVIRKGRVRRAKLYYLRERVGKRARVRDKVGARISEAERGLLKADPEPAPVEEAAVEAPAETAEPENAAPETAEEAPAATEDSAEAPQDDKKDE